MFFQKMPSFSTNRFCKLCIRATSSVTSERLTMDSQTHACGSSKLKHASLSASLANSVFDNGVQKVHFSENAKFQH